MEDRVSLYPGRVKLEPVAGQTNVYDLTRADEPTQEGTPLSKASLLKDATAALYGLGTDAVPDEVLGALSKSIIGRAAAQDQNRVDVRLGAQALGSVVYLHEGSDMVPFYVAAHNYEPTLNGEGRTLLVRKDCYDKRAWNATASNVYDGSSIDSWLNGDYKVLFSSEFQAAMGTTTFKTAQGGGDASVKTLSRSVFLLSVSEMGESGAHFPLDGTALDADVINLLKIAGIGGTSCIWWTRSPYTDYTRDDIVHDFDTGGAANAHAVTQNDKGSRPAFTLPSDTVLSWIDDETGEIFPAETLSVTPSNVLGATVELPYAPAKVGDTFSTVRTDVGDKWALCNGDAISRSKNKALAALVADPGAFIISGDQVVAENFSGFRPYSIAVHDGLWVICGIKYGENAYPFGVLYTTDIFGEWTCSTVYVGDYDDRGDILYADGKWWATICSSESIYVFSASSPAGPWTKITVNDKTVHTKNVTSGPLLAYNEQTGRLAVAATHNGSSTFEYYADILNGTPADLWEFELINGNNAKICSFACTPSQEWAVGIQIGSSKPYVFFKSGDNGTWTDAELSTTPEYFNDMIFDGTYWVTTHRGGYIQYTQSPITAGSWAIKQLDGLGIISNVFRTGGYDMIYSGRTFYKSSDLVNWELVNIDMSTGNFSDDLVIAEDAGIWLAVPADLSFYSGANAVYNYNSVSNDGFNLPAVSIDGLYTYMRIKE